MSNIIQKYWKRNLFFIFLIIFFFILGFWSGNASAETQIAPVRSESIPKRPEFHAKQLIAKTIVKSKSKNFTVQMVDIPEPPTQSKTTKVSDVSNADPIIIESHELLMESAGIPSNEWWAVELLIQRESSWQAVPKGNPNCIGLGQNCKDKYGNYWLKDACPDWETNPICQLKRFDQYVRERYGNWPMAWAHSESTNPHWY